MALSKPYMMKAAYNTYCLIFWDSASEFLVCIAAIAMALAIVVLVLGSSRYQHWPVADSPLVRVAKVVAAAITTKQRRGTETEYDVIVENYEDATMPLLLGNKHDEVTNTGKPHWLDAAVGHRDRGM